MCRVSFFDRCCLGHPTSRFCRCDWHASSAVSDSSSFSKLCVTTMFVTTADTTTLSFSTPSLVVVQQLTSIRFNSSALGFPLSAGACCESFLLLASFTHSPRLSSFSCFFTFHHVYNITSSSAFNKYFSFLHHSSRIYFRTSFFILSCMHVVH